MAGHRFAATFLVLCEALWENVNAVSPLKQPFLFLLSTPAEQDFHSLPEKDTAVYHAFQHWISLIFSVLVMTRSLLLLSNLSTFKNSSLNKEGGQRKEGN